MSILNRFKKYLLVFMLVTTSSLYATSTSTSTSTSIITNDVINPTSILNTLGATDIVNLSGVDNNGKSVDRFIIVSLPNVNLGTLYMADGKTAVFVNQVLTLEEANGLTFDPRTSCTAGTATFTYIAMNSDGVKGNVGTVSLPLHVADSCNEVTSDDKLNPQMLNTLGAVNILDLSGKDGNGDAVDSFAITSLPSVDQGVLYLADGSTEVSVNQTLTLEEANGLKFDPKDTFVGDVKFTYVAIDDSGIRGNVALVTIPLINPIVEGNPTADDKINPQMLNTLGAVNILDLSGKDNNEEAIERFTITSLPSSNQGVLYLADGRTEVSLNQTLTLEEANGLRFDPKDTFVGDVKFTYVAVDSNGARSNNATVIIPLVASNRTDIVTHNDEAQANGNADPITINVLENDTGDLTEATVYLITDNGEKSQMLTASGEGVWTVNDDNTVTFTPVAPFVGTPTSIMYVVQDSNGALSNSSSIAITGTCVCDVYEASIPVFSTLGLIFMFLISMLLGLSLVKREALNV